MKVAQHFSAGKMMQKTRPSRSGTIEPLGSESRMGLHKYKQRSIVPSGTNCLLETLPSNKLLGYFHRVPAGQYSSHATNPYVDADGQPPDWVIFTESLPPPPSLSLPAQPLSYCGLRRTSQDDSLDAGPSLHN